MPQSFVNDIDNAGNSARQRCEGNSACLVFLFSSLPFFFWQNARDVCKYVTRCHRKLQVAQGFVVLFTECVCVCVCVYVSVFARPIN